MMSTSRKYNQKQEKESCTCGREEPPLFLRPLSISNIVWSFILTKTETKLTPRKMALGRFHTKSSMPSEMAIENLKIPGSLQQKTQPETGKWLERDS
jgi:hypothetical protein